MKRVKKIALIAFHHEYNSFEYLVEVIRQVLGYETSQAANCANIIYEKGSYILKTFNKGDLEKASAYKELLHEHGIPAKITTV